MRNGAPPSPGGVKLTGRRLDPLKREAFDRRAQQSLASLRASPPNGDPPAEHFAALQEIVQRAEALAVQFHHVMRHPGSAQFLRDAWRQADSTGRQFPEDLIETLQHLAFAATIWQPDEKPAHRPVSYSPAAHAVTLLALDYWSVFGQWPTVGTGSPFVRYCREALGAAGLVCPSVAKIAAIIAPFRK